MFPTPEIRLEENQKRVLRHLRQHGSCSRQELSTKLGVTNSAMTRYTRELSQVNLIEEAIPDEAAGRGRPSRPIKIKADGGYAIGVSVHKSWIDVALVDLAGSPIAKMSFDSEPADLVSFGETTRERFKELINDNGTFRQRFLGFGISVPGFITPDGKKRHTVPELIEWRGQDVGSVLTDIWGGSVWVENDVNAVALAHYYSGRMSTKGSLLAVYLDFGIGGGCVLGGDIHRGAFLNAGSIGTLHPRGEPRPSAIDLVETLQASGCPILTIRDLDLYAEEYRDTISKWTKRVAQQIIPTIHAGVSWTDPEAVYIAGSMSDWLIRELTRAVNEHDWEGTFYNRQRVKIVPSDLGGMSPAIGAAIMPIHEMTAPLAGFRAAN